MGEQDGGGVVPIVPVGVHLHGVALVRCPCGGNGPTRSFEGLANP